MFGKVLASLYFISLGLIALNSYFYPGFTNRYLLVDAELFALGFIVLAIWFRLKYNLVLPKIVRSLNNFIVLPLTGLTAIALTFLEASNYDNYVFMLTGLHYDRLSFIPFISAFILAINLPRSFYSRNLKLIVFLLPLILFVPALMISYWPMEYFREIVKEDRVIENTQVFVLLASAVFSLLSAKLLFSRKQLMLGAVYILITLGLFGLAGEEISWGQRLLGLEPPASVRELNVQDEMNFHNLEPIAKLVGEAYVLVGFVGAFSWLFFHLPQLKRFYPSMRLLFPPAYLFIYFFVLASYNLFTMSRDNNIRHWSEPVELLFYLAVFLFIFRNYIFLSSRHIKR
jgi:hypothetical protein